MKKLIPLFLAAAMLLFVSACTKESPEPLYVPDTAPPTHREATGTSMYLGITFQLFNDNTCEILEIDTETYGSTRLNLPDFLDDYKVIAIADEAFCETSFSTVVFPKHLERIGARAFEHCQVSAVTLPDSVTEIGEECFSSCVQLKELRLSASLTEIPNGAFYGCSGLTRVEIPEGVTAIGAEAFGGIPSLKKVTLPSTLQAIGGWAFWNTGIEASFSVPDSVREIGSRAFDQTPWLTEQKMDWIIVGNGVLIRYNGSADTVTLPDTVRYLSSAFTESKVLSVTLPDTLTGVCEDALEGSDVSEVRYLGSNEEIKNWVENQ